jgi:phthalate 4,5-cis-dihydrodiol dehydrogenase
MTVVSSDGSNLAKSTDAIRVGFAGLGVAGAFMIRAAVEDPHIVLAACADPVEQPRLTFLDQFGARGYERFRDLCEDDTLDAIYIATPHEFHASQAALAMECGKHVVVEKPLALSLSDCDLIIATAARTERHLIVGHTHGFDPNIKAIREIVRSGTLGDVSMILSFNYTDFLYRPRRPEEMDTSRGGGIMFNQVSHQIEIIRAISTATPVSIKATVGSLHPSRPTEGNCMAHLSFDDGSAASIVYSGYDFFDSDEFHGWISEGGAEKSAHRHGGARQRLLSDASDEDRRKRSGGFGTRPFASGKAYQPHFGSVIVTCEKGEIRVSPQGVTVYGMEGRQEVELPVLAAGPGYRDVLEALWKSVRLDESDYHDARWGKATLEIAMAARQSAFERREIFLHHQLIDRSRATV